LKFNVQSENMCAVIEVTMQHWGDKLKYVKAAKGKSYSGAEFTKLKFDVRQDSLKTAFVFKSLEKIID
jgi:hypothetical protein